MERVLENMLEKYDKLMVLKLFVSNENSELKKIYMSAIEKHNNFIINNDFPDAGFDLFFPTDIRIASNQVKVNLQIRCSATIYSGTKKYYSGYYLYPRSSIVKTSLRLANNVGIIDSGYRNDILTVFDNHANGVEYGIKKHTRLVQICAPTLCPIYVVLVNNMDELSEETQRGMGGFGSTGTGI